MAFDDPLRGRPADAGPKMIPCELRPAATNSPSNSGTNPSWKFESGVKLSGARRKCAKPIDSSSGTRWRGPPRAPARSGPSPARTRRTRSMGTADGAHRLAVRLERADDVPAAVLPDVHGAVEVAQERRILRRAGRLLGHDPDMLGRVEGDAGSSDTRQLARPETCGEDHGLRLDRPARRVETHHPLTVTGRDRNPVTSVSGT